MSCRCEKCETNYGYPYVTCPKCGNVTTHGKRGGVSGMW